MLVQVFDNKGKLVKIVRIENWVDRTPEKVVELITYDLYEGVEVMDV